MQQLRIIKIGPNQKPKKAIANCSGFFCKRTNTYLGVTPKYFSFSLNFFKVFSSPSILRIIKNTWGSGFRQSLFCEKQKELQQSLNPSRKSQKTPVLKVNTIWFQSLIFQNTLCVHVFQKDALRWKLTISRSCEKPKFWIYVRFFPIDLVTFVHWHAHSHCE